MLHLGLHNSGARFTQRRLGFGYVYGYKTEVKVELITGL